jgi:hypothetical protein
MTIDALKLALEPVLALVSRIDPADPEAAAKLERELPLDGPVLARVRELVRAGVEARWLADRENDGIRFSRIQKAAGGEKLSVDCVHMNKPALGHSHPNGEIDLCFAVSGSPTFDQSPEGWTVYAPGTWHVPTVAGGAMDILYFLPGGAIVFGDRPATQK